MNGAIDLWLAGARRAWAARGRVGWLQGLRALLLLGPELLLVWAIDGARGRGYAAAALAAWVLLECTAGAWIDLLTTRAIAAQRSGALSFGGAVKVALARTLAPLVLMAMPAAMTALAIEASPSRRPGELVTPVLLATAGTLLTSLGALHLHLRMAVAYAAEDGAAAPEWARKFLRLVLVFSALSSTVRFGAAWAASTLASVAGGGLLGMVVAIAAASVVTRPMVLGAWAEAWRVGSTSEAPARRR